MGNAHRDRCAVPEAREAHFWTNVRNPTPGSLGSGRHVPAGARVPEYQETGLRCMRMYGSSGSLGDGSM
jgi:hypothetical protein